jgi:nucleotide-binding universal stress UspA family protein
MRDIRHILCPVDLSDISRHAVDHAVRIAGWYESRITALHVCNPIAIPATDFAMVGSGAPPVLTEEEISAVRARLVSCFAAAGAEGADVVIESGQATKRILELAASLPADLIVIGTHGIGGFQHLVLGSVTEKVLRQATCPVLTVPPHARTTSKLPYKRILCPVDFSTSSLAALGFAFSLAQEGDADLTILNVCDFPPSDESNSAHVFSAEYRRAVEHDTTKKLESLVLPATREWCRPATRLAHGKAYREILGIATEDGADLIVMGVHGRNALDVMLFGSTTNQVVRRATCPVLTVRG